jgi:adenine-specific DNA-methyltransferase
MAKTNIPNSLQKPIEQYEHKDKERLNNPPVGLVDAHTDNGGYKKKTYEYDPHLDPQLQWAGKAEHTSFEVPTVSLHVHERIDPRRIIESVKKEEDSSPQMSLFEEQKKPLREAIEFYKHRENWSNRLIAGDSLLVMNSLLEKEGMGGKVQMVYFDPPYGIKYGSNFMPFVNKKIVTDGKDDDLSSEPEMLKAFRDTWELGVHSYLTYLRDRLLLAKELLNDTGSIFIQISDENIHHIREIMDEVFGVDNFICIISYKTNSPLGANFLPISSDYIIWYAKKKEAIHFNKLYFKKEIGEGTLFTYIEEPNGNRRKMTPEERRNPSLINKDFKVFFLNVLLSSGYTPTCTYDFEFQGKNIKANTKSWRTTRDGMKKLIEANRLYMPADLPYFVGYYDDYPVQELSNHWNDTRSEMNGVYAVQTQSTVIQRCLLMSTNPGDLVLDITCGSGTTAFVAEQFGRRWITCDTSRIALTLAKQRLITANFNFYELAHPSEGVSSGFNYKTVPHVTLGSIANNEPPKKITLYDQPLNDNKKVRVTGPNLLMILNQLQRLNLICQ